jgi:hypothetical protein
MRGKLLIGPMSALLLRPRVVHRLPGRLRVRIPALKRLARGCRPAELSWRELRLGPHRIPEIAVNLTTGSLLIRYRPEELTEAELLGFLRAVSRLALGHWNRFRGLPKERRAVALQRLAQAVGRATRPRLALEEDLEIPEDVWA